MSGPLVPVATQTAHPARATARTVLQAFLTLCILAPAVVLTLGVDAKAYPLVGVFLAVCAGVTRVFQLPAVTAFLGRFLPFLAPAPVGADGIPQITDLPVVDGQPLTVEQIAAIRAIRAADPVAGKHEAP